MVHPIAVTSGVTFINNENRTRKAAKITATTDGLSLVFY
jgi:hypothetical protein